MSKISSYAVNSNPDTQFLFLGTDPLNHSMASTGTTEVVPLGDLVYPVNRVYNAVVSYGADPTGATECHAAIQAAITAAAADPTGYGIVYVPAGTYLISGGWSIPSNVAFIGAGNIGSTVTGVYGGTVFKLSASFSGTQVINLTDVSHSNTNGPFLQSFLILGVNYTATAVDGIRLTGPVMTTMRHIGIVQMSGWGINTILDSSASEIGAFGQNWFDMSVDSCNTGGINLIYVEDSTFINVYVIGINNGPGWQICGVDNTHFIGCRAEWCATYGFWFTNGGTIDWSFATGFCIMNACSTDRNQFDGVRIDGTWNTSVGVGGGPGGIFLNGHISRRDGAANTGAAGSYAGIQINGTNLPVVITGLAQMTGIGDGGVGNLSPRYGVNIASLGTVNVQITGGIAWGYSAGVNGTSTNTVTTGIQQITGANYSYTG